MKDKTELQLINFNLSNEIQEKENAIFYLKEHLNKINLINSVDCFSNYRKKFEEITELYNKSEKDRDSLQLVIKGSEETPEKIVNSSSNSLRHLENHNKMLMKEMEDLQHEIKFLKLQQTELKINEEEITTRLKSKSDKIKSLKKDLTINQSDSISSKTEVAELTQRIALLHTENEKLEREMIDLKCSSLHSIKFESSQTDCIDSMLKKRFTDQRLENPFVKTASGLYAYGTKKVNVSMKKGNLICKVGGDSISIDEFIKREQRDRNYSRSSSITSPLSGLKKNFGSFSNRHGKANSLVYHLVSPKQGGRDGLSLDLTTLTNEKLPERNFSQDTSKKRQKLKRKY